jgi:hypothetical protein
MYRKCKCLSIFGALAVACGCLGAFCPAAGAAVELAEPVSYHHAGIRMAMPAGYEKRPLEDPYEIVFVEKVQDGEGQIAIRVHVAARDPEDTPAELGNALSPKDDFRYRQFQRLKTTEIEVAGRPAQVRVMKYRLRGVATTAFRAYFLKPPKEGQTFVLGYEIAVEARREHGKQALAALAAVLRSVKLMEATSPLSGAIELQEEPTVSEKFGFSLRLPEGWSGRLADDGSYLQAGRMDFSAGASAIVLRLIVKPAGAFTSQEAEDFAVNEITGWALKNKLQHQVVHRKEADVAGEQGRQFLVKIMRPAPPNAEVEPPPLLMAQRTICKNGLSYWLRIQADGGDADAVIKLLDEVAGGMKLTSPAATRPSIGPTTTTAPAEEPAGGATTAPATSPAGP